MKVVTDTARSTRPNAACIMFVRPGLRITEMQISQTQQVPWHVHNHVQDTLYVVSGAIRIELRNPVEEVRLTPGQHSPLRRKDPTG